MRQLNRLRYLFNRRQRERELAEEIAAHRAMLEDRATRDGLAGSEARSAAARALGNSTLALEASRERWSFTRLESLLQDMRYAFRCFSQAPLFAGTVILTISLALGLNTVLFTLFNAYVLAPFEVRDPHSLYAFWWNTKTTYGRAFSWNEYQQVSSASPVFSDVLALRRATVRTNGDELLGQLISGNYFSALGVAPEIGRTIEPSDEASPGSNAVVVLSFAAWQGKFGADPSVIGRKIALRGYPFEIVGVAPAGFGGILNAPADFWAPLTMYSQLVDDKDGPFVLRDNPALELIGRLNAGVSVSQARAELTVLGRQLSAKRDAPDRVVGTGFESRATTFPLVAETIGAFLPGAVAFVLVLLLGCANVANMMLARALARQHEIAVRLALGAPRARLIRQLLTEGVALAVPSACVAWLIAQLAITYGQRAFFAFVPPEFAKILRIVTLSIDWRVFSFLLIASCASTILFALPPALQATRSDIVKATRGRGSGKHRAGFLRNSLVVVQVVICVMLLVSCGIMLRTGRKVKLTDSGMDVHNVVEMNVPEAQRAKVMALLNSVPSVQTVAAIWKVPLMGFSRSLLVSPEGSSATLSTQFNFVGPEYFDVFRVPIREGRNFSAAEALGGAPVVILSDAAAKKFWPGGDALGKALNILPARNPVLRAQYPQYSTARVIGVSRDVVSDSLFRGSDEACVYFPVNLSGNSQYSLAIRVRGSSEVVRHDLDLTLESALPGSVDRIIPMEQVLDLQYLPFRMFSWISSALGAIALALTAAGVYGVIAYLVGQRTREVGIRMALGATSSAIAKLILSESTKLTVLGLGIGAVAAVTLARALAPIFFGMNVFDLPVYLAAFAIVLVAALLASAIPARRAAKLDPMITLRHE